MKKLTADDPESRSPDIVAENVAQLKALFPELVTEGPNGVSVNVDVLKQLVGDKTVTDADEKYGLNWHGKRRARQLALTPSTGTLRPGPEESVDWNTTQNLMIEGDNLEVLKLLQKSYAGKVKLIYIDQPYNTGKDFVYPDDYRDNIKNYLELTGQVDGGRKITSNTESSGRFHTNWLNMMYPRLRLARNLLKPDGAIFVSIADQEIQNLRIVMNELFGEENFVATVIWQKVFSPKNSARHFSEDHDYIVVYARSAEAWAPRLLPRTDEMEARYSNPDNDSRGPWTSGDLSARNYYGEGTYPVTCPSGRVIDGPPSGRYWVIAKGKFDELDRDGRIWWGADGNNMPRLKRFLSEVKAGRVPQTLWTYDEVGHTQEAKKELLARVEFPNSDVVFDTPKPTRLIRRILQLGTAPEGDDIVLDFFAGTGTTMDATFAQNAEDGGKRRCILVQLPEPLPGGEAAGLSTIADITKERLRRAGKKIREEIGGRSQETEVRRKELEGKKGKAKQAQGSLLAEAPVDPLLAPDSSLLTSDPSPDLGFRVFKLDSSNIRAWEPDRGNLDQSLLDAVEHLKTDRTEADILYELLLKLGLDLCVPIEKKEVRSEELEGSSHTVHAIGAGALMACLSERIPQADVERLGLAIVEWHTALAPAGDTTCVFRDSAFADDVAKTNLAAILEQHGIAKVRSI